jgi:Zn-dependent M28 family amino/carboxypeptidase
VDLIGYVAHPTASFNAGGKTIALKWPDDYVANSRHKRAETNVDNSDVVFVGYGVVAPEYGWDDYKGLDVKGKTILMLVNDPAVRVAGDTALDSTMFKGRAMTYYGRWTYKYEIATQKGAAAAIIIHETGRPGIPYEVVRGSYSWSSSTSRRRTPRSAFPSRMDHAAQSEGVARRVGQEFRFTQGRAARKDFKPVALNAKATFHIKIDSREIQSHNIVAKLDGGDKKDEYVVYTAHWDHLGKDPSLKGDQIYNGAIDNASGTAELLEIAKAFSKLPSPPRRSVLFLSVTAREKNLLGAKFYATHPLYPLDKTVANINMDGINQWGKTTDFTVIGLGNSTLDDVLADALKPLGRVVKPDAEPEKGFYYRSDHFEFAKQGVPALDIEPGTDFIGKPKNYGMQKRDEYTNNDYHKPSDEIKPDWDLSGAVDDARVLFRVGHTVSQADAFPEWKSGNEFKAKRDSMMKAADSRTSVELKKP